MTHHPKTIAPEQEALLLANYLLRTTPSKQIIKLYSTTVKNEAADTDKRLIAFSFGHPRLLKAIDGGLALLSPNHELRRRIFIMFALLEASPKHTEYFLPIDRSPLYIIKISLRGVGSLCYAILGILIIKLGRFHV